MENVSIIEVTSIDEAFALLDKVAEKNTEKYSFSKCAEELAELLELCLKSINKKGTYLPKKERIIEEMAHVHMRMYVLCKALGIDDVLLEEEILKKTKNIGRNFHKYTEL